MTTPLTNDLSARLEEAKNGAAELARATEELTTKLQDVEEIICGMNLGVSASVVIYLTPPSLVPTSLSFRKDGHEWGLFIESDDSTRSRVKLRSASRKMRVLAASSLLALVEALIAKVAEETTDVQHSVAVARGVVLQLTTRDA